MENEYQRKKTLSEGGLSKPLPPPKPKNIISKRKKAVSSADVASIIRQSLTDSDTSTQRRDKERSISIGVAPDLELPSGTSRPLSQPNTRTRLYTESRVPVRPTAESEPQKPGNLAQLRNFFSQNQRVEDKAGTGGVSSILAGKRQETPVPLKKDTNEEKGGQAKVVSAKPVTVRVGTPERVSRDTETPSTDKLPKEADVIETPSTDKLPKDADVIETPPTNKLPEEADVTSSDIYSTVLLTSNDKDEQDSVDYDYIFMRSAANNRTYSEIAPIRNNTEVQQLANDAYTTLRSVAETTDQHVYASLNTEASNHNMPTQENDNVSTSQQNTRCLLPTSGHLTLKEVINSTNINLPQLAEIKKGYTCPIAGSVTQGEVLLLVDSKKVTAVKGVCTWNGQPICLLQNSKITLSPVSSELAESDMISVEDLFSCKQLPPVVKVMRSFASSRGHTVSKGTLLFFDRDAKQYSRLSRKMYLKARTKNGENITIPSSSNGIFSISPDNLNFFIAEVIHYFKFPIVLQANVKPTPKVVNIQAVCQQDMLVAQSFDVEKGRPKPQYIEMPVSWDVTLVTVSPEDNEEPYSIAYYSSYRQSAQTTEDGSGYDYIGEWLSPPTLQNTSGVSPVSPTPGGMIELSSKESTKAETSPDENIRFLKTLTSVEVLQLLEGLKMQEYQVKFKEQTIDGELLSTLIEEDLLKEFQIQNPLDRLQLMRVITGKQSAEQTLTQMYI